MAARRLLEAIESSPSSGVERVPSRLVVRRFTDVSSCARILKITDYLQVLIERAVRRHPRTRQ